MDDVVTGLEEAVEARSREPYWFGTAGHGVNLFQEIWKHERHVFTAGSKKMGQVAGMPLILDILIRC